MLPIMPHIWGTSLSYQLVPLEVGPYGIIARPSPFERSTLSLLGDRNRSHPLACAVDNCIICPVRTGEPTALRRPRPYPLPSVRRSGQPHTPSAARCKSVQRQG